MVRTVADVLQAGSLVAASEEPVAQLQHPEVPNKRSLHTLLGEIVISHTQTFELDMHLQGMAMQDFADPAGHVAFSDSL